VHLPEVVNQDKIIAFEDQPDYGEPDEAGKFWLVQYS
jgi:hypothetical protein